MDVVATLIEATVYDPVSNSTKIVRFTNRNDPRATTYQNKEWLPILKSAPTVGLSAFNGSFTGVGELDLGPFTLTLVDGLGDDYALMAWAGADIYVYAGDMQTLNFSLLFRATGNGVTRKGRLELEIGLNTRAALLETNLLYFSYAGIGQSEGEDSIRGTLKPWAIGDAKFCRPVLIDSVRQVYQVHGYGPVENTYEVFEGGLTLGPCYGDYNDYANFINADLPQGKWIRLNGQAMIRLGSQPTFPITCNVLGDVGSGTTALKKAGDIIKRMVTATTTKLTVNQASIDALNAAFPSGMDQYFDGQLKVSDALKDLLLGIGGYYTFNESGELIVGLVRFSAPTLTLSGMNDRLPDVLGINQLPTSAPVWELRLGAAQCHYVHQSNDISGLVVDLPDDILEQIAGKNRTYPPSAVPPSDPEPVDGDLWPDTSITPTIMRRFHGPSGTWVAISSYVRQGTDIGVENGATVGAPPGTPVGTSTADQVVYNINFNALSMAEELVAGANMRALFDLRTLVGGKSVATAFLESKQEQQGQNDAFIQQFNAMGAVTPDGSGWQFNLDTLYISPTETFNQRLTSISTTLGDQSGSIETLNEVLIDPSGATVRSVLKLDANGYISGMIATNDGRVSTVAFRADIFQIVSSDGSGNIFTPFTVIGNVVRMTNVEVDTIKAGSVTVTSVAPGFSAAPRYTASDVAIGSGETTVIETATFPVGTDNVPGSVLATFSCSADGQGNKDAGLRYRVYTDTGSGYGSPIKIFDCGIRTSGGDTGWIMPVAKPISISAPGNVKIRVTAQTITISGGDLKTGTVCRDVAIDIIRVGR